MSDHQSKLEAINNGIKAIEFIQKNRDSIIKTYGRSAIGEPKTKERTRAWEMFTSDVNTPNDRPSGGRKSETGNNERENRPYPKIDQQALHSISESEDHNYATDNSGNHKCWDVDNPVKLGETGETKIKRCDQEDQGGSNTNSNGGDEPNDSSIDNDSDNAAIGIQDRTRTNSNGIEIPKGSGSDKLVVETTQGDLDQIMEEAEIEPKKKLKSSAKLKILSESIPSEIKTVKKTTEENSLSHQQEIKSSSKVGAIQPALQLGENPPDLPAAAGNVLLFANNAPETTIERVDMDSPQNLSIGNIEAKIDTILENQSKILTKLTMLAEIKEEISGIKKTLTNQSLALSTIEKYISDMMIIIPKSGLPETDTEKEINPDLRLVIGRDNTRGLKDVSKRYNDSEKIDISEDLYIPKEIDSQYILKDIDNSKNNAAKFVPTNDQISIKIIKDIVEKELTDVETRNEMLALIDECTGKIDIKDLYKMISDIIF